MLNSSVIIPFYILTNRLFFIQLINELLESDIGLVVLVDDGSGGVYDDLFERWKGNARLKVLRHAVNSGKGAAIKSGLNYVYCTHADQSGVVIMHANGQHRCADALKIAHELQRSPHCLIQGVGKTYRRVPGAIKIADNVVNSLFRLFTGTRLSDVTAGMRGIPRSFIPTCLKIQSNYYEFDIDLILLSKYNNIPIKEVSIDVANENVSSSRFHPVWDSMRLAFVLFRFFLVSLLTAVIDLVVFILVYRISAQLVLSIFAARLVATTTNYRLIKNRVFYLRGKNYAVLSKYFLLVFVMSFISWSAVVVLATKTSLHIITAKFFVESVLFLFNFLIERDFIFTSDSRYEKTNWDAYYEKPYASAHLTRKIMERRILSLMRRYVKQDFHSLKLLELGGANSCFLEGILQGVQPKEYHVIDNNDLGLSKLKSRVKDLKNVYVFREDILTAQMKGDMDLSFSVGLIEHFNPQGTRQAIKAHFDAVKPGGIVLMAFPTSTWLYHLTRFVAVSFGLWIFEDERPIPRDEIISFLSGEGKILDIKTIWSIFLTQMVVVIRKE